MKPDSEMSLSNIIYKNDDKEYEPHNNVFMNVSTFI